MKKLMTLALGMALAFGLTTVGFAKKDDTKKEGTKKKGKKKTEGEKKGGQR